MDIAPIVNARNSAFATLVVSCVLLLSSAAAAQENAYPNDALLVEPQWLAQRLDEADILVVDMRRERDHARAHVPGAVHLPVDDIVAAVDGVPFEFDAELARSTLRRIGLQRDHTVVIYDDLGMMNASRLFWTLEYVGHPDARVLHGGWNAWQAAGLPVEEGVVEPEASDYALDIQARHLVDVEELHGRLDDPGLTVADARSYEEYVGDVTFSQRAGRVPGAVHLPWFEALTGGDAVPATQSDWQSRLRDDDVELFRTPDALRAWLQERGLEPQDEIVTYCQTLWRGAHLYFVLRLMGYEDVRGYDGSWAEWGNRDDLPVETGEPTASGG